MSERQTKPRRPKVVRTMQLVLVDETPLRQSAFARFTTVRKAYLDLRLELIHHHERVRPTYSRWFVEVFQEQLERLKTLQNKVIENTHLVDRIEDLYFSEDFSYVEASEMADLELVEWKKRMKDAEGESKSQSEQEPSSEERKAENEGKNDKWRREEAHGPKDESSFYSQFVHERTTPVTEHSEAEIKSYFRKIAQMVHPDTAQAKDPLFGELWEEAGQAKQNHDLETLKMIWALLSIRSERVDEPLSLSDLENFVVDLKSRVRKLQKEKRKLVREDPAWGFETADKAVLTHTIAAEFRETEKIFKMSLRRLLEKLAFFKGKGPMKKKRRGRRSTRDLDFMGYEF